MINQEASNSGTIKSVQKSLKILHHIMVSDKEVSIKELNETFGYSMSTIHHMLKTMVNEGFVSQNQLTRKYKMGYTLLSTMVAKDFSETYFARANALLKELVEEIDETSGLYIRRGNQAVCMTGYESNQLLRAFLKPGRILPLHSTAAGKILLAYINDEDVLDYIKKNNLKSYQMNTITDEADLKSELKSIRTCGYALEIEEYENQINAISVPVLDHEKRLISTITVIGPSGRMTKKHMLSLVDALQSKAENISEILAKA